MVAYELYWLNPTGEYHLIGILPERRKDPMRITKGSVMNWGKMLLGDDVDCKNIFFKQVTIDCISDILFWHDLSNHLIKIKG